MENKDVRILIVDDEQMMADSLRQHLLDDGYSVDTAATGAAAIERFDQGWTSSIDNVPNVVMRKRD